MSAEVMREAYKEIKSLLNDTKKDVMDSGMLGDDLTEKYREVDLGGKFQEDIRKYLLYLAASDGIVVEEETDYIFDLLGISYDEDEAIDIIEEENIYSTEFEKMIPDSFQYALEIEKILKKNNKNKSIADIFLKFYENLGKEILACDEKTTEEEVRDLNIYLDMLKKEKSQIMDDSKSGSEDYHTTPIPASTDESDNDTEKEETLEELQKQLNDLTGLTEVKQDVGDMICLMQIRNIRKQRGLKVPEMSLHMVFTGNPGTGKTTVARLLGKIYNRIGVLSQGQMVEVDRAGLVGGYVGQTALKVKDVVDEAMGGILFIDEAYTLAEGGDKDYGQEAINTLLKYMEDYRNDLVVIVAGYPELMDHFIQSNPGLKSRFNKFIYFRDYNSKELYQIFHVICAQSGYVPDQEAEDYLKTDFDRICHADSKNFANGREVRNFFEKALVAQAKRLVSMDSPSDEELNTFTLEDFKLAENLKNNQR